MIPPPGLIIQKSNCSTKLWTTRNAHPHSIQVENDSGFVFLSQNVIQLQFLCNFTRIRLFLRQLQTQDQICVSAICSPGNSARRGRLCSTLLMFKAGTGQIEKKVKKMMLWAKFRQANTTQAVQCYVLQLCCCLYWAGYIWSLALGLMAAQQKPQERGHSMLKPSRERNYRSFPPGNRAIQADAQKAARGADQRRPSALEHRCFGGQGGNEQMQCQAGLPPHK